MTEQPDGFGNWCPDCGEMRGVCQCECSCDAETVTWDKSREMYVCSGCKLPMPYWWYEEWETDEATACRYCNGTGEYDDITTCPYCDGEG